MEFPLFLERRAPVTGAQGLLDYNCIFRAMMSKEGLFDKIVGAKINVTTCCPCSKKISAYGAHNQRSEVSVDVRPTAENFIWFEDLVDIAEKNASCALYPILKRQDEKNVTEQAYDRPKFVEDMVRDIAIDLFDFLRAEKIAWFYVSSNNFESIHNHDAFAKIERGARGPLLNFREMADVEALL